MAEIKTRREPIFRISRRDSIMRYQVWAIRYEMILLALAVCAVVIYALTQLNPIAVYKGFFDGALGTNKRFWVTTRDTMTLLCIALALSPAFRMRFWNIGAEGQVLIGGLATAAVMIYCTSMPTWLLFTVMASASLLAGLIWGLVPSIFKAIWNTNETLFTLMLNYVAMQLVTYFIVFWENPKGSNSVGLINMATKTGWLPKVFGEQYSINVIIVLALAIMMFFYMRYSKHGYEISVVGSSERTAKYAGINVKWVIMRTMMLSGAICGLAGFLIVSGASHTISTSTAGGRGFTAIIVAWLAKFNPFVMILVAAFLVFMQKGAGQIATQYKLNENASDVITGIILFFILSAEFFITYKLSFRRAVHRVMNWSLIVFSPLMALASVCCIVFGHGKLKLEKLFEDAIPGLQSYTENRDVILVIGVCLLIESAILFGRWRRGRRAQAVSGGSL